MTEEDLARLASVPVGGRGGDAAVLHVLPLEFTWTGPAAGTARARRPAARRPGAHRIAADAIVAVHPTASSAATSRGARRGGRRAMRGAGLSRRRGDGARRLVSTWAAEPRPVPLFAAGRLALVEQVQYGGEHVTGDLAWGLSTSRSHAERIKNLYGGVQWRSCDEQSAGPGTADRRPPGDTERRGARTRMTQIIRAAKSRRSSASCKIRWREERVLTAIRPAAIVLTGGGQRDRGCDELAQEMFGLPVRLRAAGPGRPGRGPEKGPLRCGPGRWHLASGEDRGLAWGAARGPRGWSRWSASVAGWESFWWFAGAAALARGRQTGTEPGESGASRQEKGKK